VRTFEASGAFGNRSWRRCAWIGAALLVVSAARPAEVRARVAASPVAGPPGEPMPYPRDPIVEAPPEPSAPTPPPGDDSTAAPPVEPPSEATPSEATPTDTTAPQVAAPREHVITPIVPEVDTEAALERPRTVRARARTPKLAAYLTREVPSSARFLDHGVIEASIAGGYPHLYRLGLGMGLFDHVTVGLTVHWLPGQSRPRIAPRVALAAYRWRWIEVGAAYDRSLYPPPEVDDDPETWSFQRDAHWITAVATFSQSWISAGFEIGVVRGRVADPGQEPTDDNQNPAVWRNRLGGGVMVRMGTRRWGFSFTGRAPWAFAEAAFDLRFGAFELRRRGGWKPEGIVRATDRRVPRRR